MASVIDRLTLNQRLAVIAVLLGAVAVFAAPYRGTTVTVNTAALAAEAADPANQLDPRDLAAWIVAGRADYRVVDVRDAAAFAAAAIPGAEHVPPAAVLDAGFQPTEKIVIVGEDGVASAQAWLLLRAKGYAGARVLKGGMAGWVDRVVSPVLIENPTPEQKADNDKRSLIAAYFGGTPRMPAGTAAAALPAAPGGAVAAPVAPARVTAPVASTGPAKAPAKKKREGC